MFVQQAFQRNATVNKNRKVEMATAGNTTKIMSASSKTVSKVRNSVGNLGQNIGGEMAGRNRISQSQVTVNGGEKE